MEKEIFEKGKILEQRIHQLILLKNYMESFLALEPFSVTIETSVLGQTNKHSIPFINSKQKTYENYLTDTDDGNYIIDSIQERIDCLKDQFNNL